MTTLSGVQVGTPKVLVLLSGGLDSTTVLARAIKEFRRENVRALSIFYGQSHSEEIKSAGIIAGYYRVLWSKLDIDQVFGVPAPGGVGSALLGGAISVGIDGQLSTGRQVPMPHETYEDLAKSQGPSPTYVPFRNGTMISVATIYALQNGFTEIHVGVHAGDAHNWAYPDCTPEFIGAMANAVYVGTYGKVRLVAPLQYLGKADIVKLGQSLEVPFDLTMSCYEGKTPPCGVCPTCVSRAQAFEDAGLTDPLVFPLAYIPTPGISTPSYKS